MKHKLLLISVVFVSAVLALLWVQAGKIDDLTAECARHKANTAALMKRAESFKISDSLNCARAEALRLKIADLKRFRESDAATIKQLTGRNRKLQAVTAAAMARTDTIRTCARDTLIRRDTAYIRASCFDYSDKWTVANGCIDSTGQFTGVINSRDSVVIVETVQHARFLGFLWKLKRVKNRQINCYSKNPRTSITGIEHIIIE